MLDELEKDLLEKLTFEESIDHLLEEVDATKPVLIDVLKGLLTKDYVAAYRLDEKSGRAVSTPFYDADNMQDFLYRATKKGLDVLY